MMKLRISIAILLLPITQILWAQSIKSLKDSMEVGDLNCQVELGLAYYYGDSIEQDKQEAFRLVKDAADKDNGFGQYILGNFYKEGIGVEKDSVEAFRWLKKSADKGNKLALHRVGEAYEFGDGVEQNMKDALRYYRMALDAGYKVALVDIASAYAHGRGVERDLSKSFTLLKEASDDGIEAGKILLIQFYFNGWGTEKNMDMVNKLLRELEGTDWDTAAKNIAEGIEDNDTIDTYSLQFRFIPSIVWAYQNGEVEKNVLTDITEWKLQMGAHFCNNYEWDWQQISSNIHHCSDSLDIIVYRMPNPKEPPLCKFTAAVIDKAKRRYQYFTLEKSVSIKDNQDIWFFCGVGQNYEHLNYGLFDKAITEENFVKSILNSMK